MRSMDEYNSSDLEALTFGNVNACSCETFPCYHDLCHERIIPRNTAEKIFDLSLIEESSRVAEPKNDKNDNSSNAIKVSSVLKQENNLTNFLNKEHGSKEEEQVIFGKRKTIKYLSDVIVRQNSLSGFNFDNTDEVRDDYIWLEEKKLKHCQSFVRQVQKKKLDSCSKSKAKKKKGESSENKTDESDSDESSSSSDSLSTGTSSDSSSDSSDSSDSSSDSSSSISSSSSSSTDSDSSSDESDSEVVEKNNRDNKKV